MLFFLDQNLDFKRIERDRFHKVRCTKNGAVESIELVHMFVQKDGAGEIKRLTEFMQDRDPALYRRRPRERKPPHDLCFDLLMTDGLCPDAHYLMPFANQPMKSIQPVSPYTPMKLPQTLYFFPTFSEGVHAVLRLCT